MKGGCAALRAVLLPQPVDLCVGRHCPHSTLAAEDGARERRGGNRSGRLRPAGRRLRPAEGRRCPPQRVARATDVHDSASRAVAVSPQCGARQPTHHADVITRLHRPLLSIPAGNRPVANHHTYASPHPCRACSPAHARIHRTPRRNTPPAVRRPHAAADVATPRKFPTVDDPHRTACSCAPSPENRENIPVSAPAFRVKSVGHSAGWV